MKPTSRSLSDRLVARAVILAMDPVLVIDARADTLLRIANGSRAALEQALRRIEWGHLDRPSRYAATATETIRVALGMLESAVWASPRRPDGGYDA
jgi:hypothetical protein